MDARRLSHERLLAEVGRTRLRWGRADGSMVPRSAVVAQARSWIGTPWAHQHHYKGVGCDCGGLVRGVSIELGLLPADYADHAPDALRGYGRQNDGQLICRLCDLFWHRIELDAARPGDIVVLRIVKDPQHAAFLGDYLHGGLSMIHALVGMGVREHRIDESWRKRIIAAYALPGVE